MTKDPAVVESYASRFSATPRIAARPLETASFAVLVSITVSRGIKAPVSAENGLSAPPETAAAVQPEQRPELAAWDIAAGMEITAQLLPLAAVAVIGDGPLFVPPKVAKAATTKSPCAGLLASVRVDELLIQALVT